MSQFKENFLVTLEDIKLFADVAGDPNPIHQNKEVAQSMGLEGPIAHGMFVYSYLLRRLDEWMSIEATNGRRWKLQTTKCRFHEPALIGKSFDSVLELSDESDEGAKMNMYFFEAEKKLCHVVALLKK